VVWRTFPFDFALGQALSRREKDQSKNNRNHGKNNGKHPSENVKTQGAAGEGARSTTGQHSIWDGGKFNVMRACVSTGWPF